MSLPDIATRDEWLAARTALLAREKELTRARDALNAERRRLPMVEITKDYAFEGAHGRVSLLDLFEGRRQLIVKHFMFGPDWEAGCPSCTAGTDEIAPGLLAHLHSRETTLVQVARAPYPRLEADVRDRGWAIPTYSSYGSDFNYDFDVTLDPSVKPPVYNYRDEPSGSGEQPGQSAFLRDGDRVFHTYSWYARGAEMTGGSYYWLDMTALGRQEDWEEPKGRAAAPREGRPRFDD
jgi:predicted dithiol-disulfide oxidoreductase (DUF899 family)